MCEKKIMVKIKDFLRFHTEDVTDLRLQNL